ncbi:hypothetical protein Absy_008_149 [Acetobacter orientalis]|uniref:Uncharacterized protein n=1 Tax=Acetobacter orientalis TaxID=146474 RepID=A0A2Z5ZHE5_9PROT|nr:hypothetical protein Absy_008_149 [Acetobacter orientalis]
MNTPRNIVAFVGQNENNILRQFSLEFMSFLDPAQFKTHVINLMDTNWLAQLEPLTREGIFMAWSHAGIGAGLGNETEILWDQLKVPFVSVLADPPCWCVKNHFLRSRYVANAYIFPEWLNVQNRFVKSPQLSTTIPHLGITPNSKRDAILWRNRPQRMVLVKSGGNPELRRKNWNSFPKRWRNILEEACDIAIKLPTGDITDIFVDACIRHDLSPEHRVEIFYTLMYEADMYVREYRMNVLVRALLDLPVNIYGRGWDHLAPLATKANFYGPVDATHLSSVYASAQFLLNTSPNVGSTAHERVGQGLDSRCVVVSDHNTFSRENLSHIPTFHGFDTSDLTLKEQLHTLYHAQKDYTDETQIGVDYIAQNFDCSKFMHSLLDIANEIRIANQLENFIPPQMLYL